MDKFFSWKPGQTLFGMEIVKSAVLPENVIVLKNGKELVVVNVKTGQAFKIEDFPVSLPIPNFQPICSTKDLHGNHCPNPATLRQADKNDSFYACDDCWGRFVWEQPQTRWLRDIDAEMRRHSNYFLLTQS